MSQTQRAPVQLAPGQFPAQQERVLNDALRQLTPSDDPKVYTPTLIAGNSIVEIPVKMPTTNYTVKVEMSWFAQWRTLTKRADFLSLEFSNPPAGGDALRVELS